MMAVGRNISVLTGSLAAALLLGFGGSGRADNGIPYSESFESIPVGTQLASTNGVNGWYGESNACSVVSDSDSFSWGYPLPSATHTNVLSLEAPVTNRFSYNPVNVTNVYIDLMVKPVPRENPPAVLPDDVQVAMYMGADGKMNMYHAVYLTSGSATQLWSQLDYNLNTGEWVRVTLEMDYLTDNFGSGTDKYFRVKFNGDKYISSSNAYDSLPLMSLDRSGTGTYFLVACGGEGSGNPNLTSLSTEGPGLIDDVFVTTNAADIAGRITPGDIHGVPYVWYESYGIAGDPDGDLDNDGIKNWAEWVLGTLPNASNAALAITSIDGAKLSWAGQTTNTGSSAMIAVYRTQNLNTNPIPWQVIASDLSKATSEFQDPAPPNGNASYKVGIPWSNY